MNSISALGTTEVFRACAEKDTKRAVALSSVDHGYINYDWNSAFNAYCFTDKGGERISIDEIARRHESDIRRSIGIRQFDSSAINKNLLVDIAAPLPDEIENGQLDRIIGLSKPEIRGSSFSDMVALLHDYGSGTGPSLQSKMLLYAGLSSIVSLPSPLCSLVSEPSNFQVVFGSAFPGLDSMHTLLDGMQTEHRSKKGIDRFALRLAASLNTHGPALLNSMLAPSIGINQVKRRPEILDKLNSNESRLYRVPQCPIVSSAACASGITSFIQGALNAVGNYPGAKNTEMFLWGAADAALEPDARILEGFGPMALMN